MRHAQAPLSAAHAIQKLAALGTALAIVFTALAFAPGKAAAAYQFGEWHEYNGHWYTEVYDMGWQATEDFAVAHGGHLVDINDQAEQDWLHGTFPDGNLSIGFNDIDEEGTWVWTSGDTSTYTDWADGEPNDWEDGVPGEDIAVMNWTPEGYWNDLNDNFTGIIEVPEPFASNDNWDEARWVGDRFDDTPDMAIAGFQADEPMPCVSGVAEGSVWYWFWNPATSGIRIEIDGDDGDLTAALYGPFGDQPTSIGDFQGMEFQAEQGPCTWSTGPDSAYIDGITAGIYFIQLTSSHGPWAEAPSIHVQRNWANFWVNEQTINVTSATVDRAGNIHFEGTAVCEFLAYSPDPEHGYPLARFEWTSESDAYYWYQTDGWASQALGRKTLLQGGGRGRIDCTNVDGQGLNHWYLDIRSNNGKFGPNLTNLDMSIGDDTCTDANGCYFYSFASHYEYVKVTKAH